MMFRDVMIGDVTLRGVTLQDMMPGQALYRKSGYKAPFLNPGLSFPYPVFISCSFENASITAIMRIGIQKAMAAGSSSIPFGEGIVSDR